MSEASNLSSRRFPQTEDGRCGGWKKLYGSCQPSSLHARTAGGSRLRSRISGTNTRDRLHLVLGQAERHQDKDRLGAAAVRPRGLVYEGESCELPNLDARRAGVGVGKIERTNYWACALRTPGRESLYAGSAAGGRSGGG